LAVTFYLMAASSTAHAQEAELQAEPPSKKDQYLLDKAGAKKPSDADRKRWHKSLKRRIGKTPKAPVNIYNKWTHEMLAFDAGDINSPPGEIVNKFLRCHFTNAPAEMDPRLLPVLLQAAKRFNVKRVDVVSGFRDPKYNLSLRKKGRQVARSSEHTLGHAIDFRLPGVGIEALHAWARGLRLGGVGFYHRSRFIHVDVGRVRYWNGT
jgi:uncharacterized protein YcbK (DUF882 family)